MFYKTNAFIGGAAPDLGEKIPSWRRAVFTAKHESSMGLQLDYLRVVGGHHSHCAPTLPAAFLLLSHSARRALQRCPEAATELGSGKVARLAAVAVCAREAIDVLKALARRGVDVGQTRLR